jgi:hypothetical protein
MLQNHPISNIFINVAMWMLLKVKYAVVEEGCFKKKRVYLIWVKLPNKYIKTITWKEYTTIKHSKTLKYGTNCNTQINDLKIIPYKKWPENKI